MRTAKVLGQIILGAGLAFAVAASLPGESSAQGKIALIKSRMTKQKIIDKMEEVLGTVRSDCQGAKAAEAAFNACRDKCAQDAGNAPITPTELAKCGDMAADDCAAMLIAQRSQACIESGGDTGCKDKLDKLEQENAECKDCNASRAQQQQMAAAVAAQRKAVADEEARLAVARGKLARAELQFARISARAARACAAAAR